MVVVVVESIAHPAIEYSSSEQGETVKTERFISGLKDIYTKRETLEGEVSSEVDSPSKLIVLLCKVQI